MRALTRKSRAAEAAEAAERWARIYRNDDFRLGDGRYVGEIRKALEALGSNPDPNAVDAVIGSDVFTCIPDCDVCGEERDAVLEIETQGEGEDEVLFVCADCLDAGRKLLEGGT